METAVFLSVVWSYNTNHTKISLITTIIGNNFTDMYIVIAKACSNMIQEGREKGLHKSRHILSCAPSKAGGCTEKIPSASFGWKRLSLLSSPEQLGISHPCPSPPWLPLSGEAEAAFGEHHKCPWSLYWVPGKEKNRWGPSVSAQFSLADWWGMGWQRLSTIVLILFFFPTEVFTHECFLSVCMVSIAVTYLKARCVLNNSYEHTTTATHPNWLCRSLEYILFGHH